MNIFNTPTEHCSGEYKWRFCELYPQPKQLKKLNLLCWTDTIVIRIMGNAILYEHVDFKGRAIRLLGGCNDLREYNFNDKVSSIVIENGIWLFYEHVRYGGKVVILYPGRYSDLRKMGFNDKFSSCRGLFDKGSEPQLYLFADKNYGGRMVQFLGSDANLVDNGFNDATSSVIVLGGRWSLYKHVNYGTCLKTCEYGFYPTLDCADNQISSVRLVGPDPK